MAAAWAWAAVRGEQGTLVPRESAQWRLRLVSALEDAQAGRHRECVVILQEALESEGSLMRVPADFSVPLASLQDALHVLSRQSPQLTTPADADAPSPPDSDPPPLRRVAKASQPDGSRYLSVSTLARAVLAVLPPDSLEEYRRRFEGAAEQLGREVQAGGGQRVLEVLAFRYGATRRGAAAQEELGDVLLEDGAFRSAFQRYGAAFRGAAGREPQPAGEDGAREEAARRLGRKLLLSAELSGDPRLAASVRQELASALKLDGAVPQAAGENKGLDELAKANDAAAEATALGPGLGSVSGQSSRWGGELPSGALPQLPGRQLALSWMSSLWAKSLQYFEPNVPRRLAETELPGLEFPFVPLVHRDQVFLSGVFHLYKLDGRPGAGKLLSETLKPRVGSDAALRSFCEWSNSPLYTVTLWQEADDEPLPQADGFVSAGSPGAAGRGWPAGWAFPPELLVTHFISARVVKDNYMGYDVTANVPTRSLYCCDPRSHAEVWRTNDLRRVENRDRFGPSEVPAHFSFTSPVVVSGGLVFAGGWRQEGYVNAVVRALDLRTGETVWETLVHSGQLEMTMFGELAREPLASFVLLSDGVLYYQSNLGAVAALEPRSGRLLWVSTYEFIKPDKTISREPRLRSLDWGANPPLLLGHVLVVTPRDSHYLLAFDTGTGPRGEGEAGRILWAYDNSNQDLRDFLGYHEGALYFTGKAGVTALDVSSLSADGTLASGKPAWGSFRAAPRKVSRLPWTRGAITAPGALCSQGVVYAERRMLRLVDFDLTERRDLLAPDGLPGSPHGALNGRVKIETGIVLMTSPQILSTFTAEAD
jgi:hypothetical protein